MIQRSVDKKRLALISPLFLVLCFPSILLVFLGPANVGSVVNRVFLVSISIASIGISFSALPWRVFLWLATIFTIGAPLEVIHILIFSDSFSIGMLNCALDTNPREAQEMLGQYFPVLLLGSLAPVYSLFLIAKSGKQHPLLRRARLGVLIVSVGPFLLLGLRYWHWGYRGAIFLDNYRATISQSYPLGAVLKLQEAASVRLRNLRHQAVIHDFKWHAASRRPSDTELVVLILGESSRPDHWQINGYSRKTNPNLVQDTSLLFFADVVSGANITNESIAQILTLSTPDNPALFDTTSSVLSAFSESGWETIWLSNQGSFSAVDSKQAQISREAHAAKFLPSFAEGPLSHHDQDLLPLLDSVLMVKSLKKFIVLHTMGSHFRYYYRYPSSYEAFASPIDEINRTPINSSRYKELIVNSYDNSIVYTDWIISQIIARIYKQSSRAILVYCSDHGESLFDGSMKNAGHGSPNPAESEFRIPLIFAANSAWKNAFSEDWRLLQSRKSQPTSSRAILPTLLSLAGIETPLTSNLKSLTSPQWESEPRLTVSTSGQIRRFEDLPHAAVTRNSP